MNKKYALPPLVFVETGRKPSKCLLNNLKIHVEKYPNRAKILILSKKFLNTQIPGVEMVFEETLPDTVMLNNFSLIKKNWKGLQHNYWTNTTKRFYILEKYMDHMNIDKLIHLESDCVLLDDSEIEQEFNKDDWGLKYPKQHNLYGCASILLINKKETFREFLQYILKNWHRNDVTDMNLLGEFIEFEYYADYLPSANLVNNSNKTIYDGGSIGRYFLGADARNCRFPFSARGLIDNEPGSLKVNSPVIKLTSSNFFIYSDIGIPELKLNSIHINSKRIPRNFKLLKNRIISESNSNRSILWRIGVFDFLVFLERLISFINRRFLINKSRDIRFR